MRLGTSHKVFEGQNRAFWKGSGMKEGTERTLLIIVVIIGLIVAWFIQQYCPRLFGGPIERKSSHHEESPSHQEWEAQKEREAQEEWDAQRK